MFLKRFFFYIQSYRIRIIFKLINLTHILDHNRYYRCNASRHKYMFLSFPLTYGRLLKQSTGVPNYFTLGQSRSGSNDTKMLLHISHVSRNGASPSDAVLYPTQNTFLFCCFGFFLLSFVFCFLFWFGFCWVCLGGRFFRDGSGWLLEFTFSRVISDYYYCCLVQCVTKMKTADSLANFRAIRHRDLTN